MIPANYKPNSKLPRGARLLKPMVTKEIGSWVRMTFDASVERYGVRWLRVYKGMGSDGRREDWVADIPCFGISVHDYHWNGDTFGADHGSFDNACLAELECGVRSARSIAAEQSEKATKLLKAANLLEELFNSKIKVRS